MNRFIQFLFACFAVISAPSLYAGADDVPTENKVAGKNPWVFEAKENLPNVLILGDSISIGYTLHVRRSLQKKANVYRPMNKENTEPRNCGSTYLTIADKRIDEILTQRRWDVIHFNWGLWDICCCNPPNKRTSGKRDKINGDVSVTIENYEQNLETLVEQLKKTGAVLIWASTTVVPDGDDSRRVGDEVRYNAVADKVMKKHAVRIDDLHGLSKTFKPDLFQKPGNVHFKTAGSKILAEQVAGEIVEALEEKKQ